MKDKDKFILEPIIIKLRNLLCKNYRGGNTENTIEFVKYFKEQKPGKRLAIGFLQRISGQYGFIHSELRNYFASKNWN
jgi:hypothetical protein